MIALDVDIEDKTYDNDVRAIEGLRFQAQAGQFTAIVGPSGCGKTTLLNLVAGLDESVHGSIEFSQTDRPCIGFMFQESRLLPWLTVQQNIELVLQGLPDSNRAAVRQRMPGLLKTVGLESFTQAFPRQLSIGMQRRVSLVRAFVIQPDLLLMDEPFQSLDKPTAMQMRDLLLDLWQETRASVLFVTHSLREALMLADRILFLSARPAQVILEFNVDILRPRKPGNQQIDQFHDALLQSHPRILSGQLDADDAPLSGY